MVSCVIGSPSLRSRCLNAPRRSRPRLGAALGQWGRYLCRTATSPWHPALRVGPLGSTSVVRNRWGCTNVGHQVTLTWREQRSLVDNQQRTCLDECVTAVPTVAMSQGVLVHWLCYASYWLMSKSSLAFAWYGFQAGWRWVGSNLKGLERSIVEHFWDFDEEMEIYF